MIEPYHKLILLIWFDLICSKLINLRLENKTPPLLIKGHFHWTFPKRHIVFNIRMCFDNTQVVVVSAIAHTIELLIFELVKKTVKAAIIFFSLNFSSDEVNTCINKTLFLTIFVQSNLEIPNSVSRQYARCEIFVWTASRTRLLQFKYSLLL